MRQTFAGPLYRIMTRSRSSSKRRKGQTRTSGPIVPFTKRWGGGGIGRLSYYRTSMLEVTKTFLDCNNKKKLTGTRKLSLQPRLEPERKEMAAQDTSNLP